MFKPDEPIVTEYDLVVLRNKIDERIKAAILAAFDMDNTHNNLPCDWFERSEVYGIRQCRKCSWNEKEHHRLQRINETLSEP